MSEFLKPPAVPLAILNFFAMQPDFPALAGDMSEEFHQRALASGAKAAKGWYRREACRNAVALTWRELMRTPVRTLVVTLGCIAIVGLVTGVYVGMAWHYFHGDSENRVFNQRYGNILILLNLLPSLVMGWAGGRLLRGREWALALMFTFVSTWLVLIGTWYLLFWIRADLPPGFMLRSVAGGNLLRQGLFGLGSLWARNSRPSSSDQRIGALEGE